MTLRIELPPLDGAEGSPVSLVVVHLERLTYAGETTPPLTAPMPAAMRLQKLMSFAGLTVELFEDMEEVPLCPSSWRLQHESLPVASFICPANKRAFGLSIFALLSWLLTCKGHGQIYAAKVGDENMFVVQAPAAAEPDASAFSQILGCSMMDTSQPNASDRVSSPEPGQGPRAGRQVAANTLAAAQQLPDPAQNDSTADTLDYREGLQG